MLVIVRNLKRFIIFLICFLRLDQYVCSQTPFFSEVSASSGIHHIAKFYNTVEGGVAWFDYNNDGYEDFFVTGGKSPCAFYKNNGDGTFTDMTTAAGFNSIDTSYATNGVISGDIDNDGYRDLFITTGDLFPNLLFHNNGNGTFTDISASAHVNLIANSASAAFGDFNNDGYIDLFVENDGCLAEMGSLNFEKPMRKFFYINNGNLTFSELAVQYGISDSNACGLGVTFTDYDNDGDADLLMANDFGFIAGKNQNTLFKNNYPVNSFTDVSLSSHMNMPMNGMGIAIGDYDEDGDLDYFISNVGTGILMKSNHGIFSNVEDATGLSFTKTPVQDSSYLRDVVGWGCGFLDYDNDSYLDLFMSNGDIQYNYPRPAIFHNRLYRNNNANGTFTDVSQDAGVMNSYACRGYGYTDFNNDGHLDLYAVTLAADTANRHDLLYRNNLTSGNWLKIKTEGVTSNRDGYGTRVEAVFNGRKLIREVDGGSSFNSLSSSIVHFGIGSVSMIDTLRIKWPSGIIDIYTNVQANQFYKVVEGQSLLSGIGQNKLQHSSFYIYPNPASGDGVIFEFSFHKTQNATMNIYDITGKKVQTVFANQFFSEGQYKWKWELPADISAGLYFYRLTTEDSELVQQFVVGRK